jgi:hypothetical protein
MILMLMRAQSPARNRFDLLSPRIPYNAINPLPAHAEKGVKLESASALIDTRQAVAEAVKLARSKNCQVHT